jgi:queuine tRNA-ribosyltransferase
MGVGTPIDLLEAVHRGVDMFDCIIPVSWSQQGIAFTNSGRIDLKRGVHRLSNGPLDQQCSCSTCSQYSRAYLHHLVKVEESLGWQLIGLHNLFFYHRLMREMREAILSNRFLDYYHTTKPVLEAKDMDHPPAPKRKRSKSLPPREIGDYAIVLNKKGTSSIQQKTSGQIMHSVSDPWEEANLLYVYQSGILDRSGEIEVWDVGLGAATNAMALIRAVESGIENQTLSPTFKLRLTSFESDLDSLKLANAHSREFQYLRHAAPKAILENRQWVSKDGRMEWDLIIGDFQETFKEGSPPDFIFYDMFSSKVDSLYWSWDFFERLRKACGSKKTELFTYSNSTTVRSQLLRGGWWVSRGIATGPKTETTIAHLGPVPGRNTLSSDWLGRWSRSHAFDASLDEAIRGHEQFQI